jgi:hypothetical protein
MAATWQADSMCGCSSWHGHLQWQYLVTIGLPQPVNVQWQVLLFKCIANHHYMLQRTL